MGRSCRPKHFHESADGRNKEEKHDNYRMYSGMTSFISFIGYIKF